MRIRKILIASLTICSLLLSSTVYAAPANTVSGKHYAEQTVHPNVVPSTDTAITGEAARVREEESLRTTNSETYLLSDGTYECVVYAGDKYYQDVDNALKRIDNRLMPAETNSRGEITSYKNAANAFDVRLSSGSTPEISITYRDYSLSFSPVVSAFQESGGLSAQKATLSVGSVQNCGVWMSLQKPVTIQQPTPMRSQMQI